MTIKYNQSCVIGGSDVPLNVEDYLLDFDISTHYAESLVRIWKDDDDGSNPLLEWLRSEGVPLENFCDDKQYFISIIGT